jgi:hypothetical protein
LPVYLSPTSGAARDVRLWNEYVAAPAVSAFANVYPTLLAERRVASLFEYKEIHK